MKTLIFLLLTASLAANVWMLAVSPEWSAEKPSGALASANATRPETPAANIPVEAFEAADPVRLRDQLRASGASEELVRTVLDGVLRRRYREQLSAARLESMSGAWWRNTANPSSADDPQLLRKTVTDPLRELLGRDPRDVADAENRYPFLPVEKRHRLAEIDLDYAEIEAGRTSSSSLERLKSEREQERLLAEERRKDVIAALSPQERAEYEMRFANSAWMVASRFGTSGATEAEYRAIKPLLDDFDRRSKELPKGATFVASYTELQQRTMDQLVAAIGFEPALNYIWSGPGLYPSLMRAMEKLGRPGITAAHVLQLAAQTGEHARAIHRDTTRTAEEKTAALITLQESVRPQFDALVPPALRSTLPESAVSWFTILGEGRYKGFHPSLMSSLMSSGLGEIAPVAITDKHLPPATPPLPLPRP
jgi:hypothetical protein